MSYILDALKKTEHEKNRKNRGDGIVNIAGELFEGPSQQRQPAMSGMKVLVVTVSAVLIAGVISKIYFFPGKPSAVAVRPLPPVAPAQIVAVAPQQPVATETVPSPPRQHVTSPVPPPLAKEIPPKPPQTAAHAKKQVPPVSQPVASPSRPLAPKPHSGLQKQQRVPASAPLGANVAVEVDAAALLTQQELQRRLKDRKGSSLPQLPSMAPPADIKLSGIAYQDERRARRAVVNGFLLHEGSQVSGATITDIFQERVRFSQGGRSFEIGLTSVNGK